MKTILASVLFMLGCSSAAPLDDTVADASNDPTTDRTSDATMDAKMDATMDAAMDSTMDSMADSTMDSMSDSSDAADEDSPSDGGISDVSLDAPPPPDAGCPPCLKGFVCCQIMKSPNYLKCYDQKCLACCM